MRFLRLLRYLWSDVGRSIPPALHHPHPDQWASDRVTVSWLGHSTVLINFYGVMILTDPVLLDRVGISLGLATLGPKRYRMPALKTNELPEIDLVLLSHAHMDHFDLPTLRRVQRRSKNAVVVTAKGTRSLLRWIPFREVRELGWDETAAISTARGEVTVTAVKLRHWGARMHWDDHREYNAYIFERNGKRLCFAGDTARTDGSVLGVRGPIDLMIMPIGAYHPWVNAHCSPEEGVEMANEAGAHFVMPVHYETFKLSWEPMDEPLRRFREALNGEPQRGILGEAGDTWVLPEGGAGATVKGER